MKAKPPARRRRRSHSAPTSADLWEPAEARPGSGLPARPSRCLGGPSPRGARSGGRARHRRRRSAPRARFPRAVERARVSARPWLRRAAHARDRRAHADAERWRHRARTSARGSTGSRTREMPARLHRARRGSSPRDGTGPRAHPQAPWGSPRHRAARPHGSAPPRMPRGTHRESPPTPASPQRKHRFDSGAKCTPAFDRERRLWQTLKRKPSFDAEPVRRTAAAPARAGRSARAHGAATGADRRQDVRSARLRGRRRP